jgi:hypothetical protein
MNRLLSLEDDELRLLAWVVEWSLPRLAADCQTFSRADQLVLSDFVGYAKQSLSSGSGSVRADCGTLAERLSVSVESVTVAEIADRANLEPRTVRKACERGDLHSAATKTPRGWLVEIDSAEQWIVRHRKGVTDDRNGHTGAS